MTLGIAEPYSLEEVEEMKNMVAKEFTREEQLALKAVAERLRRPMNRKQRRAFASRTRKLGK